MGSMFVFMSFLYLVFISHLLDAQFPIIGYGGRVKNDNCPIFNVENVTHEEVPLSVVACAYAEVSCFFCYTRRRYLYRDKYSLKQTFRRSKHVTETLSHLQLLSDKTWKISKISFVSRTLRMSTNR